MISTHQSSSYFPLIAWPFFYAKFGLAKITDPRWRWYTCNLIKVRWITVVAMLEISMIATLFFDTRYTFIYSDNNHYKKNHTWTCDIISRYLHFTCDNVPSIEYEYWYFPRHFYPTTIARYFGTPDVYARGDTPEIHVNTMSNRRVNVPVKFIFVTLARNCNVNYNETIAIRRRARTNDAKFTRFPSWRPLQNLDEAIC